MPNHRIPQKIQRQVGAEKCGERNEKKFGSMVMLVAPSEARMPLPGFPLTFDSFYQIRRLCSQPAAILDPLSDPHSLKLLILLLLHIINSSRSGPTFGSWVCLSLPPCSASPQQASPAATVVKRWRRMHHLEWEKRHIFIRD